MKTHILALAMFFFSFTALSQTQKELEDGAQSLYTNTIQGNYEGLLESTYPKIFDIVPKEQMLEILKSMVNGEGYRMLILDTPPDFKYGPVKKIEGGSYSLISHNLKMKMIFDDKMTKEEGNSMIETFKQAMNADEVTFNEADNSVTILKRADVIAVADTFTNNKWKYLNRSGRPLLAKMFSEKVLKELGV